MFSFTLLPATFPTNTGALCSAEREAREPAGQFCAWSAIITFLYEAIQIFPARKPTGIFFFFLCLEASSLSKPPRSDIWCRWAITGVSTCPWFTVCRNISAGQCDTALGALLDVRCPKKKCGLLHIYCYSSPLSAFPTPVTVQGFTHAKE